MTGAPTELPRRVAGVPAMNLRELVVLALAGEIVNPKARSSPYRISADGIPRVLPGSGGITLNQRLGDPCVGVAADHVEPGVSLRIEKRAAKGEAGENLALNTLACVGNRATVISGPCVGKVGTVYGKHGGVNNVLIDFPSRVLHRLRIGDRIQIHSHGLGLRLPAHPDLEIRNCSPRLLRRWAPRSQPPKLLVPVTHRVPAAIMGSGLGRNNSVRGDYDIQLDDAATIERHRLRTLRYGDLVVIEGADTRFGRAFRTDFNTIGIVVHSDSTVSGHGPGVVTLMSGPARHLVPVRDENANLASILRLRPVHRARPRRTLAEIDRRIHARTARAQTDNA
jgi:hypothetical protein